MNEITAGNVPVSVAARVLKVDPQTVRLLLQNKRYISCKKLAWL